jgi:hypothetical protein
MALGTQERLTPEQAASEIGIDYRTLVDGALYRGVRCEWAWTRRRHKQPMFLLSELLEDLAAMPCCSPGCEEPAPGCSRRCRRHVAQGRPPIPSERPHPSSPEETPQRVGEAEQALPRLRMTRATPTGVMYTTRSAGGGTRRTLAIRYRLAGKALAIDGRPARRER